MFNFSADQYEKEEEKHIFEWKASLTMLPKLQLFIYLCLLTGPLFIFMCVCMCLCVYLQKRQLQYKFQIFYLAQHDKENGSHSVRTGCSLRKTDITNQVFNLLPLLFVINHTHTTELSLSLLHTVS